MRTLSLWKDQEVRKTLDEAIEETINGFYRIDAWQYDVWEIGYSGGKDSTALVTLLAYLMASGQLPRPKRLVVQYSDTGMELPPLRSSALQILEQLKAYGFEVEVVRPDLNDRFFVYMFGRGVPPPNNGRLRWCTRILKSKPMTIAMQRATGKKLLITGIREGESASRDGKITAACNKDSGECGQGYLHVKTASEIKAASFAPIVGWRVCHVFDWLTLFAPSQKYGLWDTSTIAEIYGYNSENGQDEPLSARTGCMECRLVQEDHMMERVIALPKYAYLAPVRRLRSLYEELVQDSMRLQKDGTQRLKDGKMPANLYRKGPLTMEARLYGLTQVKAIQAEVNRLGSRQCMEPLSLISPEEEHRILELIGANTWPTGWSGTEPLASEFEEPIEEPDVVQPLMVRGGGAVTSGKVLPFGYSTPDSQSVLDRLMADENAYLVDIRYSVKSLNKPEWSFEQLKARYGKRYLWIKDLGNVNYFNHGPIQIADPDTGIPRLVKGVEQGFTLILLCTCARYEGCHRKVVTELLQKALPNVEVVHPGRASSSNMLACLSIRQPWVWLITHPEVLIACNIPIKNIENRDWTTTMRGDLLLHAGSAVDPDLFHKGKLDQSYWVYKFGSAGAALYASMPKFKGDYPLGAIVGKARLSNVVIESENLWFNGTYGFVLDQVQAFETPITYRGALKIFSVPASVIRPDESVPSAIIYVDEVREYDTTLPYKNWCHMATSGDIESLHTMASQLGLKQEWFQNDPRHPHYDLTPSKRAAALKLGAVAVPSQVLLEKCWPALVTSRKENGND